MSKKIKKFKKTFTFLKKLYTIDQNEEKCQKIIKTKENTRKKGS